MDEVLDVEAGRRVQIWVGGAPDGVPVVFFHGCPDTRRIAMTGAAAAERAGARLIAFNRPGYGRSDVHASSQASVARDVVAVADHLGVRGFAVLGMSVGGPYALVCAARHPERVTALGVVAAPADGTGHHRDDQSAEQRAAFAEAAGEDVAAAVERFRPEFAAWVARIAPEDPDDEALAHRWRAALGTDGDLLAELPVSEVAASAREALGSHDGYLRDAALTFRPWDARPEDVRCPARLFYGELDRNAPPRNGAALAARIPGAVLVVRPGSTHLATLLRHWEDTLAALLG